MHVLIDSRTDIKTWVAVVAAPGTVDTTAVAQQAAITPTTMGMCMRTVATEQMVVEAAVDRVAAAVVLGLVNSPSMITTTIWKTITG